jgi:hypothetical protein
MARFPIFAVVLTALQTSFGPGVRFEDATEESGLRFLHYNGRTDEKYMVETMGSGGGFFDYDGDGDLDVYLLNGAPLPGSAVPSVPPRNALYRNVGEGRFVDVTLEAGVGDEGYGMGMTAADVDNDSDLDLYVTNFGRNVFYRNRGDGTFEDGTAASGLAAGGWSSSAAFADYDRDGHVDLYVARYVDFDVDNHKFCGNQAKNIKAYCHPDVYDPVPGILFRGRGDGTFEDRTRDAGVFVEGEGKGLGVVWGDYDNDSDPDLYVANDSMRNFLFRNDGTGRFEDVTLLAGVGYSEDGQTQAGMGTDIADFDGDGFLDITVTNLDFEYNAIYRGTDAGIFFDTSYDSGVAESSLNFVGFGTFFFDFDHDGLLDLFVANGHIIDNIHLFNGVSTYEERNFVFHNQGRGVFRESGAILGEALSKENVARGAAPGDYDGDGDLDVLVTRCAQETLLLRNEGGSSRSSLRVALVGRTSNRNALGARVTVRAGDLVMIREVKSGLSYLSQGDLEVHFGLGGAAMADSVEIRWPSGARQERRSVASGRILVVEGVDR